MKPSRLLAPAALAAALLLTPGPAAAQPAAGEQIQIPGGGTEVFRALLDRAGIKPLTRNDLFALRRYDDLIVVVLGNPHGVNAQVLDELFRAHQAFRGGGAVLIASDTHLDLGAHFMNAAVRSAEVTGARVECGNQKFVLRPDLPECPFVVPISPDELPPEDRPARVGAVWELFKGLDRVATNSPSYLRVDPLDPEFKYPLARFPRGSTTVHRDGLGREWRAPLPRDALFAVGADGTDDFGTRSSRLLAMADHSVFINQMLVEPGTQNLELTYRVIDFLQGPQKRKRCLFFENGRLVEQFDQLRHAFAKPRPPLPAIDPLRMQEKIVDFGNAAADWIQTNDYPGRFFRGPGGDDRYRTLLVWALVAGSICAAVFLLRMVWKARKPTDLPAAPGVAGAATGPPGVFDRRQKELFRRNNVYEPVRDLAREFFASIGIHGEQGPRLPGVQVTRVVRRPDSLREAIRDFWRLAFGPPQVVTVGRWRELEPYFDRVRKAHADGKWQFVFADGMG